MATPRLKAHQLLTRYRRRKDYPQIARRTAAWIRNHPEAAEEDVLAWVARTVDGPTDLSMRAEPAPLAIFGEVGTHIPANAVEQMETVLRLPVARRGAMMPDAHLGYAMPIGGVATLERAISPSFVGYDISCMMQLTLLDVPPDTFLEARPRFAAWLKGVTSFGVGANFADGAREHRVMAEPLWGELPILRQLKDRAQAQLGSSGGGNHFADLVLVDFLEPTAPFDAGQTAVGLLTHSGSRGTGYQVATHYVQVAEQETRAVARDIPKGYEWLPLESDAGQEYLAAMELMGRYAKANHDLIHDHFLHAAGATSVARVWNRHNYAWTDEETGEVLHRKGATPAETGELGLIPGTSGSASYLVRGLGNEESLHSSSHGAGRYFSRREAFRRHDARAFQHQMAEQDVLHIGVAPDEAPAAYKDIEMVIGLQSGVLVEPVARMRPKVVIMGGRADDGD